MRQTLKLIVCLGCAGLWVLMLRPAPAMAQASSPAVDRPALTSPAAERGKEFAPAIKAISEALSRTQKVAQSTLGRDEDLARLRTQAEDILARAVRLNLRITPRLSAIKAQVDKLGKPPKNGTASETPSIAAERARLSALETTVDGARRQVNLLQEQARQLIAKIQDSRRALFTEKLLQRTRSPLRPDVWSDAMVQSASSFSVLANVVSDWWQRAFANLGAIIVLLSAAGGAWFALRRLVVRLATWRRSRAAAAPGNMLTQLASVAWLVPARAAPGIVAALLLTVGFTALDLVQPPIDQIATALLFGFLLLVVVRALTRTLFEPRASAHRPLPLATPTSCTLYRLVQALAAVYAIDLVVKAINRTIYAPLPLTILGSFVAAIATAGLLLTIVNTRFQPALRDAGTEGNASADDGRSAGDAPNQADASSGREVVALMAPRGLKVPLLIMALAVISSSVLGYVAFGRFLAEQIVVTGAIVVLTLLAQLSIRTLTRELAEEERPLARGLASRFDLNAPRRGQLAFVLAVTLNLLLVLFVVPLLFLQWGFNWSEIKTWLYAVIFGFKIGTFNISLAHIFIALVLFAVLLFLTRMLQRSLGETLLNPSRMDAGIAHSIRTAVGYLGVALAALVAISYVGLDITNLAIVAGALSVGIGFGLQSIVNNFVSGLILLVERPIQVGDWIVVGDAEGTVRRISVRATEIETFDRASVIIPNSELITGRVMNWTHKTSVGRVVIKVGISYDSDPKVAQDLLLKIAADHPLVLSHPEAWVAFEDLGSSSLDLSLRAYIADVRRSLRIKTDLRTTIVAEFRQAGIEIPYPQHDIHLRDLDTVKAAVSRLATARTRENPS